MCAFYWWKKLRVPGESWQPATSHWQTVSHHVLSTPCHDMNQTDNYIVVIATDCMAMTMATTGHWLNGHNCCHNRSLIEWPWLLPQQVTDYMAMTMTNRSLIEWLQTGHTRSLIEGPWPWSQQVTVWMATTGHRFNGHKQATKGHWLHSHKRSLITQPQ
jgi:hypothetical protein